LGALGVEGGVFEDEDSVVLVFDDSEGEGMTVIQFVSMVPTKQR